MGGSPGGGDRKRVRLVHTMVKRSSEIGNCDGEAEKRRSRSVEADGGGGVHQGAVVLGENKMLVAFGGGGEVAMIWGYDVEIRGEGVGLRLRPREVSWHGPHIDGSGDGGSQ